MVLATGAPRDRELGIPGEDLPGVIGSAEFVGWYNGHPDFADLDPANPAVTGQHPWCLPLVFIGKFNTAEDDFDGKQLWKHNLQEEYGAYSIWWGHANSPVIHDNLVISTCMCTSKS